MTDQTTALKEDLAYMRDLAEAGASTPMIGGSILIFSGAFWGTVALAHWLIGALFDPPGWAFAALWFGAAAVALVGYWVFGRQLMRRPGASSPTNRAAGFAWRSTGWAINVLMVSGVILVWRTGSWLPMTLLPSIIAAIYGAAWLVSARMSNQRWMMVPAIGGFAFSLILAYAVTSPDAMFPIFAAAMYLLALVPGIIMVRREPSLIV